MAYKLPLPGNMSQNILSNALNIAKQYGASGNAAATSTASTAQATAAPNATSTAPTGANSNLQYLFDQIKKPDTNTTQNLPDYSKMTPSYIDWKQPTYFTGSKLPDGSTTQMPEAKTTKMYDPNTFLYINMLSGKGDGSYVPTMQMRQFQEDQNQNYINNLQNATQLNQNHDQWKQEFDTGNNQWQQQFDYNKSQDAIQNDQWQQQFDWSKYVDKDNMQQNWSQLSGYMPSGSNTLGRDTAIWNNQTDWAQIYQTGENNTYDGSTSSAIDDYLKSQAKTTASGRKSNAYVEKQLQALQKEYTATTDPVKRKEIHDKAEALRKQTDSTYTGSVNGAAW